MRLRAAIDWSHWGEAAPSDVQPMLPLAPSAPLAPLAPLGSVPQWPTTRPEVDVVVQARQQWAESCGQPPAPAAPPLPPVSSRPVLPGSLQLGQPMGGLGDTQRQLQREEPEIDPVSGLEVSETQICKTWSDKILGHISVSRLSVRPMLPGLQVAEALKSFWGWLPAPPTKSSTMCASIRRMPWTSLHHDGKTSRKLTNFI